MIKPVMFVSDNRQGGFTLIEVTMVLAISAALILIVFAGQSQLRGRVQFTDSIEQLVSTFSYAKNAAFTTDNSQANPSPDPNFLVVGTVLTLQPCPSTGYSLETLLLAVPTKVMYLINPRNLSTTWQTCYSSSSPVPNIRRITFYRQPETGEIQTYSFASAGLGPVKNYANYVPSNQLATPLSLRFSNPGNPSLTADIVIDSKANSIDRIFQ